MYPNPANESFFIKGDTIIHEINIYNLLGQKVKSFSQNQKEFNIQQLTSGTYVIEIDTENGKATSRLIKK